MRLLIAMVVATWSAGLSVSIAGGPQQSAPPAAASPMPSALAPEELNRLFPAGPGRDTTFRVCATCHPPEKIATRHQTREDWEETINAMVVRGAKVSDDDYPVILEYLAAALPLLINVNTATVEELQSGFGIKRADALAIVAYREQNGKFASLDDLKKVPNIEFKRIQMKKEAIRF